MKSFREPPLLLTILLLLLLAKGPAAFGQPTITNLSTTAPPVDALVAAPVGALVTINGMNFGATQGTSTVTFNGTPATVVTGGWSDTAIVATVPKGATTGNVVVTVGGMNSNGVPFTVGIVIGIPRKVPFNAPNGNGNITNLTVTVNFDPQAANVGLTFKTPAGSSWSITLSPGMPVDKSCPVDPTEAVACNDFPPMGCATCIDNITIIPRPIPKANQLMRFEIRFALLSNYNLGLANCPSTQSLDPEPYTMMVTTGTAITGVCVESYDKPSCTTNQLNLFTPAAGAFVGGFPQSTLACAKDRPPVNVMMVLDRSGSMSTTTSSGLGTTCTIPMAIQSERIGALKCAAKNFVDLWATGNDGGNPPTPLAQLRDQVGVVSFSTTASIDSGLVPVANNEALIDGTIDALVANGSTSIGGGLVKANPGLANGDVVLLMSDGQQNTDPFVKGPAPNTAGPVTTYCQFDATKCSGVIGQPVPLPNQPRFYTVTLGPSLTVDSAVNQAIADATLGFYLNTEDNPALLGPFFLELLQNFLKFNSYDTVALISGTASNELPYSGKVPISTTSRDVEFSLMWPSNLGSLRITVTPPGGASPIVKESGTGFISIMQSLPLSPPVDPAGDWNIQVKPIDLVQSRTALTGNSGAIPFDLHIMTDDGGVKSDLSVVPWDYKAGDKIRLRASLRYFGLPMLGLGTHRGDQIKVALVKPGQSIGDMLSDSTASSTSAAPDIQPGAEAKLFNALQNNPSALQHTPDVIQLFDDGNPEHGDDKAGDGIYSALYLATLPGHYNFHFLVESVEPNGVRFSRQQLRTVYVRSVPDADNTVFLTSIQRREKRNVFSIVMTPRFKAGPGCSLGDPKCGRMGPGWANYFWFTPAGQPPFKAKDNLDGTYTANVTFTGSKRPNVSVSFEDALAIIGDSLTFDQLPAPPTLLVDDVPPPPGRFAIYFDAGGGIPQGTFGNIFNNGFSLNAGLEYIIASHFSAEGIFGYHHFPAKIGSSLNAYQFSGNAKLYLTAPPNRVRPFVNFGPGGYKFSPGSTDLGGNFGGGVLFQLTSRFGLQGSYNFHVVNTAGSATKWSTVQGGFRLVF